MKNLILLFLFTLIGTPGYTKIIDMTDIAITSHNLDLLPTDLHTQRVQICCLTLGQKGFEWDLWDKNLPTKVTASLVNKWIQEGKKVYAKLRLLSSTANFEDYKRLLEEQLFSGFILPIEYRLDSAEAEEITSTFQAIKREFPHMEFMIENERSSYEMNKDLYESMISFIRMAEEKGLDLRVKWDRWSTVTDEEYAKDIAETLGIPVNRLFFEFNQDYIDYNYDCESSNLNFIR